MRHTLPRSVAIALVLAEAPVQGLSLVAARGETLCEVIHLTAGAAEDDGCRRILRVEHAHKSGGLVRTLDAGRLSSGSHQIEWDGRDSRGSNVQPGVYFCRMLAGDLALNRKIVLMR